MGLPSYQCPSTISSKDLCVWAITPRSAEYNTRVTGHQLRPRGSATAIPKVQVGTIWSQLSIDLESDVRVLYLSRHFVALSICGKSAQCLSFSSTLIPLIFRNDLVKSSDHQEIPPVTRHVCLTFRKDHEEFLVPSTPTSMFCKEAYIPRRNTILLNY